MKSSPHTGKLPVTSLFKNGLECDPFNVHPISVLPASSAGFLMDTLLNDHIIINNNCHACNTRYANINIVCL